MTDREKLEAYDRTLDMLKQTSRHLESFNENGTLSDHGQGSLDRIHNTIKWLEGWRP